MEKLLEKITIRFREEKDSMRKQIKKLKEANFLLKRGLEARKKAIRKNIKATSLFEKIKNLLRIK